MRLGAILALVAFSAGVSAAFPPAGHTRGLTPITTCGQVVKTEAFLTRDLACSGRAGIVVGASGITIDLSGFTLAGDRSPGRYGVALDGFDGVTVENGAIRNFDYGLVGFAASRLTLSRIVATTNANGGIFVVGPSTRIRSSNVSRNGGDGIYALGVSPTIESTTASENAGAGIYLSGVTSQIRLSTASDNADDGIIVAGNAARLEDNRTNKNGRTDTAPNSHHLGILAFAYTTAPTGTNLARGNTDPSECRPKTLC
jgi:hypothetical protein